MGLPNRETPRFIVELNRHNSVAAATKDFKGFCEWNRMDRASGELSTYYQTTPAGETASVVEEYVERKREGDRDKAGSTFSDVKAGSDPWALSALGNRHAKLSEGLYLARESSYFNELFAKASDGKSGKKLLLTEFAQTMTENLKSSFNSHYRSPAHPAGKSHDLGTVERVGLCKGVTNITRVPGCASALGSLMPKLKVAVSGASVLDPALLKSTLEDQKITRALQTTATSLWNRIGSDSFTESDNIYTELFSSLRQEGFQENEAKDKALAVLATLSAGGPNFSLRGNLQETQSFPICEGGCNPNNIFLAAIAEGMTHADTLKMSKSSKLYSLPPNVDFPCDTGKNYHFWMSAYYANQLVKEGFSSSSVRSAVYVSHLGYQISRREQKDQGGLDNNLLSMGRYTSPENGIRMDLILASAGAKFGAEGANTLTKVAARDGYIEFLKSGNTNASKEEWTKLGDPRKYYNWLDRIRARKALEAF